MVALTQYNVADLPDTGGNTVLIPRGQYQGLIVNSEMKPTRKGGHFLALTILVTQGEYANTEFIERLNIDNPNPKAVEIAYKTLARISEALGMVQTPADSVELHNKPIMFEVKTEAAKPYTDNDGNQREGREQSIISKYLALPAAGAPAVGTFTAPAAAAAAVPAAQVAAAPAAVATPPAGGNPFAAKV